MRRTIVRSLIVITGLLSTTLACAQSTWPRSPDGKYEAKRVGSGADVHYQIIDVATDRDLFRTHAQYPTPNDVKAGAFSRDSKQFAAAYHSGHTGRYTWVGIWDIPTGNLVRFETKSGWVRTLPW